MFPSYAIICESQYIYLYLKFQYPKDTQRFFSLIVSISLVLLTNLITNTLVQKTLLANYLAIKNNFKLARRGCLYVPQHVFAN